MTVLKASTKNELARLSTVIAEATTPFAVEPPHRSALEFQRLADGDTAAQGWLISTLTDLTKIGDYPLAERWLDFIDLAQRSPPLFAPVISGIYQIAIGLGTDQAHNEMDADTRWDITQKLGRHIRSVFATFPDGGEEEIDLIMGQTGEDLGTVIKQRQDCDAVESGLASLKGSGRLVAGLIDHQIRFDFDLTKSDAERFDALVLAAELLPVCGLKSSIIHRLEKIVEAEEDSDWIKPHVQAIGSTSDIKYTDLFKFRVGALQRLRGPGETLLDGLKVLTGQSRSYSYATPTLPRPVFQRQAAEVSLT